jgi:hypothetical protein
MTEVSLYVYSISYNTTYSPSEIQYAHSTHFCKDAEVNYHLHPFSYTISLTWFIHCQLVTFFDLTADINYQYYSKSNMSTSPAASCKAD